MGLLDRFKKPKPDVHGDSDNDNNAPKNSHDSEILKDNPAGDSDTRAADASIVDDGVGDAHVAADTDTDTDTAGANDGATIVPATTVHNNTDKTTAPNTGNADADISHDASVRNASITVDSTAVQSTSDVGSDGGADADVDRSAKTDAGGNSLNDTLHAGHPRIDTDHAKNTDASNDIAHAQDSMFEKKTELDDIQKRIQDVKAEYGESVKNLMDTKKDLNQKKIELGRAQDQLKSIQKDVDKKSTLDSEKAKAIAAKTEELEKIKDEIKQAQESYDQLLEKISNEQHALSVVKTQQSETEQLLEEANARLYNAKEELNRQAHFQDPSSLTSEERAFIEGKVPDHLQTRTSTGSSPSDHSQSQSHPQSSEDSSLSSGAPADADGQKRYAGVVEAASVVVASLKSKLNMTRKELEAVQLMLEQERERHEDTKRRLESAMGKKD